MSRTIRRKTYVPLWVTTDFMYDKDELLERPVRLEGKVRARALHWWHEDKSCFWGARPPAGHRQEIERTHRMRCKTELARFRKNPEYEVQLCRKGRLGHWD